MHAPLTAPAGRLPGREKGRHRRDRNGALLVGHRSAQLPAIRDLLGGEADLLIGVTAGVPHLLPHDQVVIDEFGEVAAGVRIG